MAIARTMIDAALRAQSKHPAIPPAEIARMIAMAYGVALDRMPTVCSEILAALTAER